MTGVLKVDSIQNSSGTSAMTIDSSGNVNIPNRLTTGTIPAFHVYGDPSAGWSATTGGWRDVTSLLDQVSFNDGSHYSTSTGLFTAPVAGLYFFHTDIYGLYNSGYLYTRFTINGGAGESRLTSLLQEDGNSDSNLTNTIIEKLNANDTVTFEIYGDIYPRSSRFMGYLIG